MSFQNKQELHVGPEPKNLSMEFSEEKAEDSRILNDKDKFNQIDPSKPLSLEACVVRLILYN